MENQGDTELVVTGVGVTSAIGQGKHAFRAALLDGAQAFGVMQRPGRQKGTSFLGAEIAPIDFAERFAPRVLRTASWSAQVALVTLQEAWTDARLHNVDSSRIGLIVGGSNFQQRDLVRAHEAYADRAEFLRPSYGLSFLDTDVCGICTEQFGMRGPAYTVGGASASGQLAILRAMQAVRAGEVDVCLAMGALMDLSYWECQGLRATGAMGTDRYAAEPHLACRPFDRECDGFIFGESCAVVAIERAAPGRADARPYARLTGGAVVMDGNRNPDPSCDGEIHVIRKALATARLAARDIDYINPHGTASPIGDATEIKAITACGLAHAYINATKSITGHGLSAAGAVEVVATLLQMQASRLHPTLNLDDPVDASPNWVRDRAVTHTVRNALTLSMGFGGINTALCVSRC